MTAMKTSAAGIAAIKGREGSRTTAYADVRGIATIGVGHTGPEVHFALVWTQEQVDAALEKDLAWAEAAVNEGITAPLTQNQFDALVSLTYNIGAGGFRGSSVRRQLNLRNYAAAAADFMMWDKPNVLIQRRRGEMQQFLKP